MTGRGDSLTKTKPAPGRSKGHAQSFQILNIQTYWFLHSDGPFLNGHGQSLHRDVVRIETTGFGEFSAKDTNITLFQVCFQTENQFFAERESTISENHFSRNSLPQDVVVGRARGQTSGGM